MDVDQYKLSIKRIVDSTNNENLLRDWEQQLKRDINNFSDEDLSTDEWKLVEDGIADYKNGHVLSLEEFINKK